MFPATLLDLSHGGFSILALTVGVAGERILLQVKDSPADSPIPVLARICWIRSQNDAHVIGCEFIAPTAGIEIRRQLAALPAINAGSSFASQSKRGPWIPVLLSAACVAAIVALPCLLSTSPTKPQVGDQSLPELLVTHPLGVSNSTTSRFSRTVSATTDGHVSTNYCAAAQQWEHPLNRHIDYVFDYVQRWQSDHAH
jgi:hypothetical protein